MKLGPPVKLKAPVSRGEAHAFAGSLWLLRPGAASFPVPIVSLVDERIRIPKGGSAPTKESVRVQLWAELPTMYLPLDTFETLPLDALNGAREILDA